LAPRVQSISGGRNICASSPTPDRRLARARTIRLDQLAFDQFSAEEVRDGIIEAWAFAAADPYRAATHNKGIMNGVDAVVIATGNDWRAIEAGAHACCRGSDATPASTWSRWWMATGRRLGNAPGCWHYRLPPCHRRTGFLEIAAGISAAEPAQIIVSGELAQNLAALRAWQTEQSRVQSACPRSIALALPVITITLVADRLVQSKPSASMGY
jgi:hydroxymethylglutaryl-CoA reductase